MGFNALVSLILGFSLVDMTRRRQDHFDFVGFWRRSTTAAATARRIAMRIADRVPEHHELTDEAFAAGLLQDIGMLPLQAADPERFRNAEQLVEMITASWVGTNAKPLALTTPPWGRFGSPVEAS